MIDEHFDRSYQSGRAAMNSGIDRGLERLARSVSVALETLHRIQFDAPWKKPAKDSRCA